MLSVARLEKNKRVDLAVRAVPHLPSHLRLVVVGEGSDRRAIEQAAEETGAADRITFAGAVSDAELVALYHDALCLVYAPFDEDYGLATLEAFLARKPVITARDSGGTLEFVIDGVNGFVVDPEPEAVAAAIVALDADRARTASLGEAGRDLAVADFMGRRDRSAAQPWLSRTRRPWSSRRSARDRRLPMSSWRSVGAAPWKEILVIDDGSADDTSAQARRGGRGRHPSSVQQGQRRRRSRPASATPPANGFW